MSSQVTPISKFKAKIIRVASPEVDRKSATRLMPNNRTFASPGCTPPPQKKKEFKPKYAKAFLKS